ncbi:vancomycin high temperature exclusion protein [Nocardia sp. NPDC057668]|uniref:SanA/YdcF family protein n=1 Tax=Nocardia sp. NPDC057668 TaxID=3346202 RepID=UPI00366D8F6E
MRLRDTLRGTRARVRTRLRPRRIARFLIAATLVVLVVLLSSVLWIRFTTRDFQYSAATAPAADVAIVFGAEMYSTRKPSPYLAARLDLGQRLLESGKVKALLLTGDNGHNSYNEPDNMRQYLLDRGVPANKIALDYAGFSTYDSCARAHRIFGVRSAIAVTQDFSVPRTIALCRAVGIDTVAVGDDTQIHNGVYRKCWLRDQLAAVKAMYSIIVEPDPKLLGPQESSVREAMAATP